MHSLNSALTDNLNRFAAVASCRMRAALVLAMLCLASFSLASSTLQAVSLNPNSVLGGASSTGTVTLSGPAPTGGMPITLSSNLNVATVPPSVTVAAGQTTATFPIGSSAVEAVTTVTIFCKSGGVTQQAQLLVNPLLVTSLTVSPSSLIAGDTATGTITLSAPAPKGGKLIKMTSDSRLVSISPTVEIAEGRSTVIFPISTNPVVTQTTVQLTASLGKSSASAPLTIGLGVSFTCVLVTNQLAGGTTNYGQINLGYKAPVGGLTFSLTSSNSVAAVAPTVTIPAGKVICEFPISTSSVSAPTSVTVTVSISGQTKSLNFTVTTPVISSFGLNLGILAGGATTTGRIMLDGPAPTGGAVVALTSDTPFADPPAQVSIDAGQSVVSFPITTSGRTTKVIAHITATYGGSTKSVQLLIGAFAITSLTFDQSSVDGGSSVSGTVQVNAPAPVGGATIILSSTSPAATMPATVTVPEGSTTTTFSVVTRPVTEIVKTEIQASNDFSMNGKQLVIYPANLSSVSVSPSSVAGGQASTGTLTLSGPAPTGGIMVTLSSSSESAEVPAKVAIPAGQSSATFAISTRKVKASATVQITAKFDKASKSATLTITK